MAVATYEVFEREGGKWGWKLVGPNGAVLAVDNGDGYDTQRIAESIAQSVITGDYKHARKQVSRLNQTTRGRYRL